MRSSIQSCTIVCVYQVEAVRHNQATNLSGNMSISEEDLRLTLHIRLALLAPDIVHLKFHICIPYCCSRRTMFVDAMYDVYHNDPEATVAINLEQWDDMARSGLFLSQESMAVETAIAAQLQPPAVTMTRDAPLLLPALHVAVLTTLPPAPIATTASAVTPLHSIGDTGPMETMESSPVGMPPLTDASSSDEESSSPLVATPLHPAQQGLLGAAAHLPQTMAAFNYM